MGVRIKPHGGYVWQKGLSLTLSEHSIVRAMERRTKNKDRKSSHYFLLGIFERLYYGMKNKDEGIYGKACGDGKFKVTDGKHIIVYSKQGRIEFTLITYVRKEIKEF